MPAGYQTNSNITDEEVLAAKQALPIAKTNVKTLQKSINASRKKLKDEHRAGETWKLWIGADASPGDNFGSQPYLDLVAPSVRSIDGSSTPPNEPFKLIFTEAERNRYAIENGWVDLVGPVLSKTPTFVWVMKYRAGVYSEYYKPSFKSTGLWGNRWFNEPLYAALTHPSVQRRSIATTVFKLSDKQVEYWKEQENINKKMYSLRRARRKVQEYEDIIDSGPDISLIAPDGTLNQKAFIGLVYNVGSVKEAYFSSREDFLNELTTLREVNTPTAVTNASQLWVTGFTNKGMIQPDTKLATQNLSMPEEVALPSVDPKSTVLTKRFDPTGFQFLYNPASVDMQYTGQLGVDPNMQTNGLDQFNPLGVYTQATVNFNILINRMFDFKYYDRNTGVIASKYKNDNIYYPRQPEINEQKDIFKKGTMYDVEHLLRAVLGFGMPSYLGRNMSDGKTADLGFITGIPVELHLGSNLRYLGNVSSLRVSHVLFDERMVPIFTNLSISFARLIDPTQYSTTS
jgi:hypothetical protein